MIDWFDLLAVQVTLKSLLPHLSSKAPILRCSAFFMVQLSHPYVTTGKTIALTLFICLFSVSFPQVLLALFLLFFILYTFPGPFYQHLYLCLYDVFKCVCVC